MVNRRALIGSLAALVAAPAVVHASSLMLVKSWSHTYAYGWEDNGLRLLGKFYEGDSIAYNHPMLFTYKKRAEALDWVVNPANTWSEREGRITALDAIKRRSEVEGRGPRTFIVDHFTWSDSVTQIGPLPSEWALQINKG